LILATDIAGVPVLLYAFISSGPFAVVAGLGGSALVLALRDVLRFRGSGTAWVATCAGCGLAAGVCVAAALLLLGEAGRFQWALPESAGLAGAVCGAVLGLLGWRSAIV